MYCLEILRHPVFDNKLTEYPLTLGHPVLNASKFYSQVFISAETRIEALGRVVDVDAATLHVLTPMKRLNNEKVLKKKKKYLTWKPFEP